VLNVARTAPYGRGSERLIEPRPQATDFLLGRPWVRASTMPQLVRSQGQVSIMLVATADKLRLYRCSSPRERYDANVVTARLLFRPESLYGIHRRGSPRW
jgi:hypothetical protein